MHQEFTLTCAVSVASKRATYHLTPTLNLYAAVDNLFDTEVGSAKAADQVMTIDAPRMFRVGLSFAY